MPKYASHKAFTFVQAAGGVLEYVHKKNGLHVLLWEEHSAPVVALNVTYLVGARNEGTGHTGATHLLEHLLFKGSKKFNKKNGKGIWEYVGETGAEMNATTHFDRTNYYELLPRPMLERGLAVESDRMRAAVFTDADRQSEMPVVRNEFEWGENEPREALDKQIWASAFQTHPYGSYVIGLRSDIENVPTARLRQFYDDFYWPNSAYVTLAGDLAPNEALVLIEKYFGNVKRSSHVIPDVYTREPHQEGPRRTTVRRAGEVGLVEIAHKVPSALHKDSFALDVLAATLGKGRTSRLYRALVDSARASRVSTSNFGPREGGLFTTEVTLTAGTTHEEVEKIVIGEYERISRDGISEEELAREKYNVETQIAFTRDGALAIAQVLNETIATGDWTLYARYLSEIRKVTVKDVMRVAKEYLVSDQSITGYFIPKV